MVITTISELRNALDNEILHFHDMVTLRVVGPGQVMEVEFLCASSKFDEACFRIHGKDVWLPWGDIIDVTLRTRTLYDHVVEISQFNFFLFGVHSDIVRPHLS